MWELGINLSSGYGERIHNKTLEPRGPPVARSPDRFSRGPTVHARFMETRQRGQVRRFTNAPPATIHPHIDGSVYVVSWLTSFSLVGSRTLDFPSRTVSPVVSRIRLTLVQHPTDVDPCWATSVMELVDHADGGLLYLSCDSFCMGMEVRGVGFV
jgi:hypothetical protein